MANLRSKTYEQTIKSLIRETLSRPHKINFLRAKDLCGIQTMLYPDHAPMFCESIEEAFQILTLHQMMCD